MSHSALLSRRISVERAWATTLATTLPAHVERGRRATAVAPLAPRLRSWARCRMIHWRRRA
eukprot:590962-Prymnesium_polylepis.1